ncbi:MAG: ABC transporter ATP-binding protein [Oscillospiraceae bacterium]
MADVLLEVVELKKYFKTPKGMLHAVDGVNFTIERGKTLGIVGESGCGKSTTGRAILQLLKPTGGQVLFEGKDVTAMNKREIRNMRKDMQIIFQDPYSSLDPRKTVSQIIREPIVLNKLLTDKKQIEQRVLELMELVGLAERLYNSYPHELDGGRRQRIGIARALAMDPKFIVCDEPVSALDVSIQAQILNLLKELQEKLGLTYIFITHDLSVVYHFSDDIAVMYLGQLVEKAPADVLFENPVHPYTQALLSAIPIPDLSKKMDRILLKGEITSPVNLPDACRFAKRCNYCCDTCNASDPKLVEVEPNHFVACHFPLVKDAPARQAVEGQDVD